MFAIHITCYFTYKYFTILPELYCEEQKTMTTLWRLKEKLKTKYNITKLILYKKEKGNKRKTLIQDAVSSE